MAKFRKYSTQKGHSVKYLEICNQETIIIQNRYGFDVQTTENKKKARSQQISKRVFKGYYLFAFGHRLLTRGTLKEFNPSYTS